MLRNEDCPLELDDLTIVEEVLISAARSFCYLMKLKPVGNSYSQALKGNVITFLQSSLGQLNHFGIQNVEETLTEMIVVHFVSPFRAKLDIEFKNTLKCRRDKVRTAYQKLMENSSIYGKLNLEDSEIEKLPVDGVPDCLLTQIINTGDLEFDELHSSRYSKELNDLKEGLEFEDEDDTILERSGLMDSNSTQIPSDELTLQNLRNQIKISTGNTPLNEYDTKFFHMVCPSLFPFEDYGFESETRTVKVGMQSHARHLLNCANRRFRNHKSFLFIIFNILQRRDVCRRAKSLSKAANFDDAIELFQLMTISKVEKAIKSIHQKMPLEQDVKIFLSKVDSMGRKKGQKKCVCINTSQWSSYHISHYQYGRIV